MTMANALKKTVTTLPSHLKQSLTWDRGKELSDHARFTIESGVKVFFADPPQSMAARHERKHEWSSTAILPYGYRPVPMERPGDPRRRQRAEHQSPKNTRLDDTSRSIK